MGRGRPAGRGCTLSALLLRAARWSEHSHDLFPAAARDQAVDLLRLGYLLAWSRPQHQQQASSLVDVWRDYVLPYAVTSPSELGGSDDLAAALQTALSLAPSPAADTAWPWTTRPDQLIQ